MKKPVFSPAPSTHLSNPQPHTHDMCDIGGDATTVDNCYKTAASCSQAGVTFNGNVGVLPTCTAVTPHFNNGSGTIMSYWCAVQHQFGLLGRHWS